MNSFNASDEIRTVLSAVLIVFVTFKLTDEIDWSWWWVLAPVWAPILAVLALFVVFLAAAGVDGMRREGDR
ncbi:hypothetical protein [Dietzia natronolimnaea]|uniref:hypothetical protein n=1 Tax=Dietzia natronolimnaea TaxID=161920 RepID=UPI0015F8FAD1|nr:hypothetical protein [Dietzia natronolimnaea]MBB1037364.1 hypothetical protein [Dietzia natronolimnaea]